MSKKKAKKKAIDEAIDTLDFLISGTPWLNKARKINEPAMKKWKEEQRKKKKWWQK